MKKPIPHSIVPGAILILSLSAFGADPSVLATPGIQEEFPQVTAQPTDQEAVVGSSAILSVGAANADGFQWIHNGAVLEGQTNSSLNIENVGTNDTGFYTCYVFKDAEAVPTRAAALNVFALSGGGSITVFGTPLLGGGSQGNCPGPFIGSVNFIKTAADGWGWAPTTGATLHTAADGTGRTDTKVQYVGRYGDKGCSQTTVTVPHPPTSQKYRFTIYFTNNVPTNPYPIVLTGFDP